MRRLVIHLFVALLTFAVGILASMFFGSVLTKSLEKTTTYSVSTSQEPVEQPVSVPLQSRCGCSQSEGEVSSADYKAKHGDSIRGGILNSKAVSLPKPAYPAIAKAARAFGTVTVQVVVDGRGCVLYARPVGGHPLLQSAAAQAALQACFSPTLLSGTPVKVSGVITYNFANPLS